MVIWAILVLAHVVPASFLLDFGGLRTIYSDVERGILDETPKAPISNETESFQGSAQPASDTASIPGLDPF